LAFIWNRRRSKICSCWAARSRNPVAWSERDWSVPFWKSGKKMRLKVNRASRNDRFDSTEFQRPCVMSNTSSSLKFDVGLLFALAPRFGL